MASVESGLTGAEAQLGQNPTNPQQPQTNASSHVPSRLGRPSRRDAEMAVRYGLDRNQAYPAQSARRPC